MWKPHCAPILSQALPVIPHDDSGKVLIVQQEKLLKLAVSDHIDRIVDRRGPGLRVITQPRPKADKMNLKKLGRQNSICIIARQSSFNRRRN